MNMSQSTLQRKLKAVMDRTPMGFINEFRMMQAAEMLVKTTSTVAEISFLAGCDEPTHFARMFKKHYHMSPSEYRSKHRQEKNFQ
jgi:AraC-like DNA-binding protein